MLPATHGPPPSRLSVVAAAAVAAGLCMAHEGGCHGEAGDTPPSPVNAIGMVLELEDGVTRATLGLRSDTTTAADPVAGRAVSLSQGPQAWAMPEVAAGLHVVELADAEPTPTPYRITFEVDQATAEQTHVVAGSFAMEMHGPVDRPEVWFEPVGQGIDVMWAPGGLEVIVEVVDAGDEVTWSNLSLFADDPGWSAVGPGGRLALPDEAFPVTGTYRVRVCAVEVLRRDDLSVSPQHLSTEAAVEGQLGWLSGMIVGRCSAATLTI
jgi:hypothetical protein